jgi:glutaminase
MTRISAAGAVGALAVALALGIPSAVAQSATDVQAAVDAAYAKFRALNEGKNADYIPALAKVDPNLFGIALVTADGKVYTAGDVKTEVSIQSISKVFTMAQVIQEQGLDAIEKRIGVDATGARFNSIIAVEAVKTVVGTGAPEMNPLVNPGAISATSMVKGATADQVWTKIIGFHNAAAGRQLTVLQDVYKSESDTNQRNQAIGALMLAYGYIKENWQQAVDLYTRQCSIGVNARDLATMAATLASGGKNPVTGNQVLDADKVPGVLAVMATAGLYDDSGKWLYHTGLPAKSGVGGGILAVSPGKFGIAVVSPPLDDAGNSVRAQRAIADISNALGGNPYSLARNPEADRSDRGKNMQVHSLLVCGAAVLSGVIAWVQPTGAQSKPRIVIVATGGTIAGAAESTTAAGYKSGAVAVDVLINAVHGNRRAAWMTKVA